MYFVIRRNSNNMYWWRAVADGNNEILAVSELMNEKRDCEHAISLIRGEAASAPVYDKTDEITERR